MIVRPTATAVPFSVCTCADGLALGRAVADVEPARLEVGRVRARGELAVAALARAATPRGRTSSRPRRPGRPRRCSPPGTGSRAPAGSPPRSRAAARARRRDCSGSTNVNISTLSNWCTRKMPCVSLPAAPASRRKQVREAGVAARQLVPRRGSRPRAATRAAPRRCRRGTARPPARGRSAARCRAACPVPNERLLAHQHRRDHRREAALLEQRRAPTARARARAARAAPSGRRSASRTRARRAPCRGRRRAARRGRGPVLPASPTSRSTSSSCGAVGSGRFGSAASTLGAPLLDLAQLLLELLLALGERRAPRRSPRTRPRPLRCSSPIRLLAWFLRARSSSSSGSSARRRSSSSSASSSSAGSTPRRASASRAGCGSSRICLRSSIATPPSG